MSQRIWLTGASSGIGEALIAPLLAGGARLAISARRADRLEALAVPHRSVGRDVVVVPVDVTDRASVATAASTVERHFGGIDLAVFNAGGHTPVSALAFSADPFEHLIRLNFLSVLYGAEAVLPGMLARGSGHIAAVASVAGYRALPTAAAYGASKSALIYAMDAMRFDLEPRGVRVTVINPGFVKTPLTDLNTFPMPALIDAASAAAIIVRGLRRGKKEIHFPKRFTWTLKLMRVLPYPIYERVIGRVTRGGK
jgi:NADP-dependent 3-hydroxy acid dehydrogenase YdfG